MPRPLLLLLLVAQTQAGHNRELLRARALRALRGPGRGGGGTPVVGGSLQQPLDHFDPLEGRVLTQRFWINEEFWDRPAGPVFLVVGGESALSPLVLRGGHAVELARQHGALLVALEHRFYGDSRGPGGAELRFLSSQQALADLAAFRLHLTRAWGLSPNHTWVAFGGSYAGALAAWARLKFPHLVSAAVASSAPVRAQVDFAGYNRVVSVALSSPAVGGSPEGFGTGLGDKAWGQGLGTGLGDRGWGQGLGTGPSPGRAPTPVPQCLAAVSGAFAALDARLRGRRLAEVTRDMACCHPPRERGDRALLAENVADVVAGTVQYNGLLPADSVAALCRAMTDGRRGSPYRRLVAVVKAFLRRGGQPCTPSSRRALLRELRGPGSAGGSRPWLFQTCTEFGFYPSCEDAACPFSRFQTLRAQLSLCAAAFGIAPARVREAAAATNGFYGAARIRARRLLFVNGALDPWHVLSAGGGRRGVLIAGASHCADMAPPRPGDPPALTAARQIPPGGVAERGGGVASGPRGRGFTQKGGGAWLGTSLSARSGRGQGGVGVAILVCGRGPGCACAVRGGTAARARWRRCGRFWGAGGPGAAAPPSPCRRGAASSGVLQRLGQWCWEGEVAAAWAQRLRRLRLRRKNAYYGLTKERYGDNLAAAAFALSCGGGVRFKDRDPWIRPCWRPELLQLRDVPVVAVDLSGSQLTYDGLDNLVQLTELQHLDLSGCPHVDDWALGRLHVFQGCLRELAVARCPRVTERGLATLHHLQNLRRLDVTGVEVPSPGLVRILLEEMLPRCQVLGMDGGPPPEQGSPPPSRQSPPP
ncbi:LOW QUALITY PROTEIN: distal membrane-arm assembly complex protein 2 [Anser cygnoides]|uniref:LOW QUALITY PROTEIN: distal membrane-arm assembly complex protein 2 n=1 Tax=Anser cygnoides TaxID=8845 RepID=UPI0034D37FEB